MFVKMELSEKELKNLNSRANQIMNILQEMCEKECGNDLNLAFNSALSIVISVIFKLSYYTIPKEKRKDFVLGIAKQLYENYEHYEKFEK